VLEFDFWSPAQGEVQGIGFDTDQSISSGYTYRLYGTQGWGINVAFYRYAAYAPGPRHYRIPVGESYTGNMLYLVFANDHDVSSPTAESFFSNVRVYEESSVAVSPPVEVNFNTYMISPYDGASQSPALTMTIEDGGQTLHMLGNGWLKITLPYTVTTSTVIEFDYKSASQGQIQGIGLDDDTWQQSDRTFQLYGTTGWGRNAFRYALYAPGWKHFRIPVGKYYTGAMRNIFFANDQDISNPTAESLFRNLSIHEGEVSLPVTVDFNQYALSKYVSSSGSAFPIVDIQDNGSTLHLSGNGWAQISMPVSILPDTVLAFDFQSSAQGEIHAIGFDTDQNSDSSRTFKLYGTQGYGLTTFNDYAASAPNWKHYEIAVGQYYYGEQLYLFFANDHDVAIPTAESYFKNVQISTAVSTNNYTYDRGLAVSYADDWAHYRNVAYPLADEIGCGCNDCTNYISQVLHEGGYPLRSSENWNVQDLYQWWFREDALFNDYSNTWSVTNSFYEYTKIYRTEFDTNAAFSDLQAGDFILLDLLNNNNPEDPTPDGKPDHGRVIVGEGNISQDEIDYIGMVDHSFYCETVINPVPTPDGTPVLLIDQHCIDRRHVAWDYNLDPRTRKYYIHVINQ